MRSARRCVRSSRPPHWPCAIRDRIGYSGVTLDALLAITGIQPAPQGGTIVADVIGYEMRETLRGQLVGRVQVAPH